MTNERLTTITGAPVVSNDDVQTAGRRGPILLQDVFLIEKLANFNREVFLSVVCTQKVQVHSVPSQ